jgi:hypothetical protein
MPAGGHPPTARAAQRQAEITHDHLMLMPADAAMEVSERVGRLAAVPSDRTPADNDSNSHIHLMYRTCTFTQ